MSAAAEPKELWARDGAALAPHEAAQDKLVELLEVLLLDRPRPLRKYDQIHMRIADLAAHIRRIAPLVEGKDVLVMGDSDGLVVGLACAGRLGITPTPRRLMFCDFDRRVLQFVRKTVNRLGLGNIISAHAYNVFEPLPPELIGCADVFHTNPPYGQFNGGRSVTAFVERCLAGVRPGGSGLVVTANDPAFPWSQNVLRAILASLLERQVIPYRVMDQCHRYALDDQPDLQSGVIWCRLSEQASAAYMNADLPGEFAECFYGRVTIPIPKYISLEGEAEQLVFAV